MARIAVAPAWTDRQGAPQVVTPIQYNYELRPSRELPVVDLSISIKSRFLSPQMLIAFSVLASFRRMLGVLALFSLLSYPVALIIDPCIGRPLAAMSAVAGPPVVLVGVSLLRYEVVKLLLFTHDAIFFITVAAMTLFPLGPMLQDSRAGNVATTFVGMLPNIFVDANLRAVRRLTVITGIQVIAMVLTTVALVLDVVPESHSDIALVSLGSHVLPAKMVVTNGMVTLTVLLLHNFFRKRSAVFRRGNPSLQHCVTYRARLKLVAVSPLQYPPRSLEHKSTGPSVFLQSDIHHQSDIRNIRRMSRTRSSAFSMVAGDNEAQYLQRLRYDRAHTVVDIRNTVVPEVYQYLQCHNDPERKYSWVPAISRCYLFVAFITTLAAYPVDMWFLPILQGQQDIPDTNAPPSTQLVAVILVGGYFFVVVSISERSLLRTVVSSFDFAYLSAHIVILCVCLCDFYRWGRHCVLVLAVGLWMHLGLIIDALTPPLRDYIGFHIHVLGYFITVISVGSTGLILYLLIFNPTNSARIYDRMILSLHVSSRSEPVALSVLPLFYSFLVTAVILVLRLLFRMLTYSNADLVLIDGQVAFSNCFHRR